MGSRNRIAVLWCTSEDEKHPFSQLFAGDSNTGWVSQHNPRYPIDICLDLRSRFLLTGIELVSHESMIAERVDIYFTRQEELGDAPEWDSIGYFRLHSNEPSH
jgi:hypothetical protein